MKTYTLEEIKELCEKAASVDWEVKDNPHSDFIYTIEAQYGDGHGEICRIDRGSNKAQGNADFIAASRTIVPQLVGQLEKAIKALKEVKKQHAPDTLANMIKRKPQCYDLAEQALKELGVE